MKSSQTNTADEIRSALHDFRETLHAEGVSKNTSKNYLSDIRHYIRWTHTLPQKQNSLAHLLSSHLVERYKHHQTAKTTPRATINRRLSSLRALVTHLSESGIIQPFAISNIQKQKKHTIVHKHDSILDSWKHALLRDGASKSTVRHYVADVRDFLKWLERQQ